MVRPCTVALSGSLHSTLESAPQVPPYTAKYMSVVEPARLFRETTCEVFVATKLYHTSSSAVPEHGEVACADAVAARMVPLDRAALLTHRLAPVR